MIIQGNSYRIGLRDESIHCCVTSFPYYNLRSYGIPPTIWGGDSSCQHIWGDESRSAQRLRNGAGASGLGSEVRVGGENTNLATGQFCQLCNGWLGCFGLEPSISLHVANAVAVCREIKRVLRRDGVFWLNYGDSYATGKNGRSAADTKAVGKDDRTFRDKPFSVTELPAKNLCMIPARVAIALQEDGWILRSEFPWLKLNAMPSSVTDRPGTAHEHVFMLVKSARYYFDMEPVRRAQKPESVGRYGYDFMNGPKHVAGGYSATGQTHTAGKKDYNPAGRALRTSDPFFDSLDAYIAHLQDVRDNGGMLVDSEGLPAALIVNTESYSSAAKEDQSLPHYAADRDRPYRVSPDCPIHSPQGESQSRDNLGYDERQEIPESGNPGTDASHVQEPLAEPLSSLSPDNQYDHPSKSDSVDLETSHLQTLESIGDYKSGNVLPLSTSDVQTLSRTSHTLGSGDFRDDKMDSEDQGNLPSATDRNTQSHKTDLVPSTSPFDTASAQMTFHTGDIPALPLQTDSADHTSESNTLGDSVSGDGDSNPSAQTIDHSEDRQNVPYSNCTCIWRQVKSDHYATFPRKLIAPLIKTTPEKVCPECGKAWERIIEKRIAAVTKPRPFAHAGNNDRNDTGRIYEEKETFTLGWRPTCKCIQKRAPNFGMKGSELLELADEVIKELAPIGGIVLDPFAGSGTVGQVCRELGRRFIGIDLSATYLAENALPRSEKLTSAKSLAQLPMFREAA